MLSRDLFLSMPFVMVLGSCAARQPAAPPSTVPPAETTARTGFNIRTYSDTRGVTAIERVGSALYVGTTRGLVAWDLERRDFKDVGVTHGLPGLSVRMIARGRNDALWVLTERGLARWDNGRWFAVAAPDEVREARVILPVGDGREVWVGTPRGVVVVNPTKVQAMLRGADVTSMVGTGMGEAYVATTNEGVHRFDGRRSDNEMTSRGLRLRNVRSIVRPPEGVVAIGVDDSGPRLALLVDGRWSHYSLRGGRKMKALDAGAARHDRKNAVLQVDQSIYQLARLGPDADAPSAGRGDLALVPDEQDEKDAPKLVLKKQPGTVPADATTCYLDREEGLLCGMPRTGIVRGDGSAIRARDLVGGVRQISLACSETRCYLIGTGERGFEFDGQNFTPVVVDPSPLTRVLAFARDAQGRIYVLHGERGQSLIRVSREHNNHFVPVGASKLAVPDGDPRVTFASFSPWGELWVGLHYLDAEGEDRPHGVAAIDVEDGKVSYHGVHRKGKPVQGLPIPHDVRRVVFLNDEIWMASMSGVCRVMTGEVKCYTENDGVEGGIASDIEVATGDQIWVASPAGIGRFDGTRWIFEYSEEAGQGARSLRRVTPTAVVVGTNRGIAWLEGGKREVINRRNGLLGEDVLDLGVDNHGGAWVLTAEGLTIIERREPKRR